MIGIHVSLVSKVLDSKKSRKNMLTAIKDDLDTLDLYTAQIFTHGPRNRKENNIDYEAIKNYCIEKNIYLVVHSSYPTIAIWSVNNNNKNSSTSKINIDHLSAQLSLCQQLHAKGLVVHLPHTSPDSINETLNILNHIIKKYQVPILLEIEPNNISYGIPEKLNELCQVINLPSKLWGICIDTAHMWASNIDISSIKNVMTWFKSFKFHQKISLLHLNGAFSRLGVLHDKHAVAFSKEDKIWSKYITTYDNPDLELVKQSGAYLFIKFCKKNHVPIICEINRGSQNEVKFLLNLIEQFIF